MNFGLKSSLLVLVCVLLQGLAINANSSGIKPRDLNENILSDTIAKLQGARKNITTLISSANLVLADYLDHVVENSKDILTRTDTDSLTKQNDTHNRYMEARQNASGPPQDLYQCSRLIEDRLETLSIKIKPSVEECLDGIAYTAFQVIEDAFSAVANSYRRLDEIEDKIAICQQLGQQQQCLYESQDDIFIAESEISSGISSITREQKDITNTYISSLKRCSSRLDLITNLGTKLINQMNSCLENLNPSSTTEGTSTITPTPSTYRPTTSGPTTRNSLLLSKILH